MVTHFDWWNLSLLFLFQITSLATDLTKTSVSDVTGTSTGTAATNAELIARFNLIETKINAVTTQGCW